jgi:SAM-dependent methyltransferase
LPERIATSTSIATASADYNPIAWFYDRHWSSHYHPWALQVLDAILLNRLPERSAVLDLCCGNGVMAREIGKRGFQVTGLDASEEMLSYARMNAPFAQFVVGDARDFDVGDRFDAVLCTFDSLNHILSSEELLSTFRSVHRSLVGDGVFVFDLNLEDGYTKNWGSSCCTIDDEHACFIRGRYDRDTRLGYTEVSLFRRGESWARSDVQFLQRFHPVEEVLDLLGRAGFKRAQCLNAEVDLGVEGYFSEGRGWFTAVK